MPTLDACYLSVPLPPERIDDLRALQGRFTPLRESLRLQNPATAHVTLRYFGRLTEEEQDAVRKHMEYAVRMAPFELPLGELRILGAPRRPRVVILHVESVPELLRLRDAAQSAPVGRPDDQPFLPHVTVARVAGRIDTEALRAIVADAGTIPAFTAAAVQFSSMDPDSKARQSPQRELPLAP